MYVFLFIGVTSSVSSVRCCLYFWCLVEFNALAQAANFLPESAFLVKTIMMEVCSGINVR